jgi:serine phosphatase RsbU (regulator of sigma subunit)
MASRSALAAPDGPRSEPGPGVALEPEAGDEARLARAFSAREISDVVTRGAREGLALARQNQILDTLRTATKQLVVHRPLPELFELLLDLLFAAVPAERGAILLLEGETPVIKASRSRAGRPLESVSRSIARRVLDEGVALLLPNALDDPQFGDAESVVLSQVRSALCAPLWTEKDDCDSVLGLVYLDTHRLTDAFDEDDLGLVTALANVAAVKIQNAYLLEDRMERRRLEEQMRLAAQVQASLLPDAPPELPGYSLAGSNRPCHAVGGDYYDWGLAPDGLRFALGDVAGKGAAAALMMTALRATIRAHSREPDPTLMARRVNGSVCESVPPARYATAFLARLEPASGRLTYVNAGHNPPLLVRADGSIETLDRGGLAFGLFGWASYDAGEVELQPGDALVAFSDGVSETASPEGEEFGPERIGEIARRGRRVEAGGIELAIRLELDAFSEGRHPADDRTLLVLKRDG